MGTNNHTMFRILIVVAFIAGFVIGWNCLLMVKTADATEIIIHTDTNVDHYFGIDDEVNPDDVVIVINGERVDFNDLNDIEINGLSEEFPDGRFIYRTSDVDYHLEEERGDSNEQEKESN
jgi:hypothetical protein